MAGPAENEAHCYISTFLTPTFFNAPYTAYVFGRLDSNLYCTLRTHLGGGKA